jgi:hypothetical protein
VNAIEWPSKLSINAFTGDEPASSLPASGAEDWVLSSGPPRIRTFLKPEKPADPANWRDPRVGWGLVLRDNEALSESDLASAADGPESIRTLVHERGENGSPAPVFRYRPGANRAGFLRRGGADIPVSQAPRGTGPGAIPRYLLIYGTPQQVPWDVQYHLNAVCAVGRLSMSGPGLDNYVSALRSGWKDASARSDSAVLWAVDHGPDDITNLMRLAVAQPVFDKIQSDAQMAASSVYLNGANAGAATAPRLVETLSARKPSLIVTTSHGQTGPLDNVALMKDNLGLPVDEQRALLKPSSLLAAWQPSGAIWYAHACCSAGSDAQTLFDGLVQKNSLVDRVLKGVAAVGAQVAPLPEALLSAQEPLRAFVGHVEPTFDWTLRQRLTGQFLTASIHEALYDRLLQPEPLGLALRGVYDQLGAIYTEYDQQLRQFNKGTPNSESRMLYHLLIARDVQTMVLLGDPTATLSPMS